MYYTVSVNDPNLSGKYITIDWSPYRRKLLLTNEMIGWLLLIFRAINFQNLKSITSSIE